MAVAKKKKAAIVEPTIEVSMLPIGDVLPYEDNPRLISDDAIVKVANSLREFGWQQPIVVDTKNVIIVGHTRLLAAYRLGQENVPVVVADLSPAKAKAYRIASSPKAGTPTPCSIG